MKLTKQKIQSMIQEELETLQERLTDEVYRYMSALELTNILKTDKFWLTAAVGTGAEMSLQYKDKIYYLSTARGRGGDYHSDPSAQHALVKLDGRKLNNNYSGKAVDYWSDSTRSVRGTGKSEAEDRIYSDKPTIPNASKYIKEIHFLIKDSKSPERLYGDLTDSAKQNLRSLMINAKKRGIPIHFYNNKRDFILMNPKNSVKLDINTLKRSKEDMDIKPYWRYKGVERSSFAVWTELLVKKNKKELTKQALSKLYDVYNHDDQASVLAADIHNNKSSGDLTDKRINTFLPLMKKFKLKTTKDVILFIRKKWNDIESAEK